MVLLGEFGRSTMSSSIKAIVQGTDVVRNNIKYLGTSDASLHTCIELMLVSYCQGRTTASDLKGKLWANTMLWVDLLCAGPKKACPWCGDCHSFAELDCGSPTLQFAFCDNPTRCAFWSNSVQCALSYIWFLLINHKLFCISIHFDQSASYFVVQIGLN